MPWPKRTPGRRPLLPQLPAENPLDRSSSLTVVVLESIGDVEPSVWNALSRDGIPFLRHEFLSALEISGSAAVETGWEPRHLMVKDGDAVLAAMPLYLKSHSWGEFVFDHAWAEAFHRAGRRYYPKLVSCVPFTPVTGPRALTAAGVDRNRACRLLTAAAKTLCQESHASSVHLLFPPERELDGIRQAGLMIRKDCQYHWNNRGYRSFDDFLTGFRSARRKKLMRERRRVTEAGVHFRIITGDRLEDGMLDAVYGMHALTFARRGQAPYLNRECFGLLRDRLGRRMVVVLAERESVPVACAISFRGKDGLFGRYWGAVEDLHSLHFETCFYQGIEYCIREGLARFEPGAQGEHKLRRGFDPTVTWSAHWVADPAFAAAIGNYLEREADWVDRYVIDARDQLPFHRTGARDDPESRS
jgi:predicted N-acyltransferase